MIKYLLKRLGLLAAIIFGVISIMFLLSRVLPGSPVEMMLGSKPSQEQITQARAELGLDKPIPIQFAIYLGEVMRGDLGTSLRTGQSVTSDIALRFPATLELVTLAIFLAALFGIPLGVISAVGEGKFTDQITRSVSISGLAIPSFFLALLLQIVFYGWLNILPLQGRIANSILIDHPFESTTGFYLIDTLLAGNSAAFYSTLSHLMLPVLTLAIATLAIIVRVTRAMMIEVLETDHIRTLIAFGMPLWRVHYVYALRATLIPLLTIVGLTYGYMLGGSIIVEYIFDWPGIGSYVVTSVLLNDFPAALGVTLVLATSYLLINLFVDLLYFALDPRLAKE